MTPKDKAEELYNKYAPYMLEWDGVEKWAVKECALIAVNLLMEEAYRQHDYEGFKAYWQEVKQEIEKL